MKVILFGGSGMVGQGVLRECLADPGVDAVLSVGRSASGRENAKLRELVCADLSSLAPIASELRDYDACFYCLGVSSIGMKEEDYRRITFGFTLAAAKLLAEQSPGMTFIYVSGAGTDETEHGRAMWARVKGETENALLKLPFKAAYMFRPGYIQPLDGIKSKTRAYRIGAAVVAPFAPALKLLMPKWIINTREVGRAMIAVVRHGFDKRRIENRDIAALAQSSK